MIREHEETNSRWGAFARDKMGAKSKIFVAMAKAGFDVRFRIARMTRIEPVGRLIEKLFFDEDRMIYLPKDRVVAGEPQRSVTIKVGKSFETVNTVLPSQVVEHFIRESKYHFIMDFCLCRDANGCKDYPKDLGCLFLGKGALRIDKSYGRLVTAEEALAHMRRCREAGLVHLIGRNKIDSVVFDTGRKEDLMSICSCCPCCCLWKMLPDLNADIGGGVTKMPGVVVKVTDGCTGCDECVKREVCFVRALSMKDGKARIDPEACRGCGRCVEFCPHRAVEMTIEDKDFLEKSIRTIEPLVDIRTE